AGGLPLDNAAHAGGFLSGMAFGAIASVPRLLPARRWHRSATVFFTLCAFALASMEGVAVAGAVRLQPRTLHAEGAQTVVPWYVVELIPGVADTADYQFQVQLRRSADFPHRTESRTIDLGSHPWEERRAIDSDGGDRKSTRLNSSHRTISYAVFRLKKKNKNGIRHQNVLDV